MSVNYRKALVPEEPEWSAECRVLLKVSAAGDDHDPCESWGHVDVFDGPKSVDRAALEGLVALETEDVIPELCDPDIVSHSSSEDERLTAELESLLSDAKNVAEQDRRDYLIDDAPDVLTTEKITEFVSALLETYGHSHSAKAGYVMKYAVPIGGLEENGYNKDGLVSVIETIALTGELSIEDRVELVRDAYEQVLDRVSALRLGRNVINAMFDDPVTRERAERETLALIKLDTPLKKDIGVYETGYSRDTVIDDVYVMLAKKYARS